MTHLDYPFRFGNRGRTALTPDDDYIRDLIEQVLFTAPGERVNRPSFGCGVMQLVFAPNSVELAAAAQFMIQGALQEWLSELIVVEAVNVVADGSALHVAIAFVTRRTETRHSVQFTHAGGPA